MTTTWRLLGGVGLISVMLGLGCNGNSLGGGTDPNCPDPNNCQNPNPVAEFSSLNVMPNQVTLDSQDGAKTTQQFVVTGTRPDGTVSEALPASYTMSANGIGTIDSSTGLFTATGEIGGTVTITATVISNSVPIVASFQVTVNVTKNIIVSGTPADAATHFTGTPTVDNTKAGGIVYPLNNVVMPQNVYPADIQWTNGVMNDIYRVQITKPNFSMTTYVQNKGGGVGLDYIPDTKSWAGAAQTSPDSDATLTVDRWDSVANKVYSGNAVKMHFAKGSLLGSVYYWDIAVGRIRRIDDGTANSVNFMPTPPTSPNGEVCIGCHVVSRDGRYMVGRLGGGDNVGGIFDLTVSQSPAATSTYPINGSLQKFWFSTLKPDNSRILGSETPGGAANSNIFVLLNSANGAVVTPTTGALPTKGTHPNWSPDGNTIAYVSEANSWGGDGLTTSNLSVLPVTGPDAFGTPKKIHTSTSISGSTVDTYPTWSPDSKWIAFHNGINGRSDDKKDGALYMISPDGATTIKLTNATTAGASGQTLGQVYFPNFSPFNVGGYFWLAYVSNRPYGNSTSGTLGSPHQQMWVAAVKNNPVPGEDPSCVPYWLPGQVRTAQNISAYWAPKACRLDNDSCSAGSECCSGVCTGGKCQPPPNRCLVAGETCGGSGCCGGLTCDAATHICQGGAG